MRANFSLDYEMLTVQQPTKLYLLARFESGRPITTRRPLNISLVIDRSGSMAGARIDYTRQAAQFLVQHLGSQDILSIILYNDKVETLLSPQNLRNKDQLIQRIEQIKVRGTTNLSGGWLEGCANVSKNVGKEALNRVILMSDGHANRGVVDVAQLVQMARQKYEDDGISTTMMGLGSDFNEDLLISMANAGGGAFYFIESPEVAPTIFQEELSGLLNVVGQNLTIKIEPQSQITKIQQLNAYGIDLDGDNVAFRLGDIFADEVKTLLLELTIPALADLGELQIATLVFEYDEITPDATQHHIIRQPVTVNVADQSRDLPPNREVLHSVLLLQAANARKEAVRFADRGDYEEASRLLREVADAIEKAPIDDEQLKEEHQALQAQAKRLEQGASAYDDYSRKTMSTQALYSMTNRHSDTVNLRMRESHRHQMPPNVASTDPKNMPNVANNLPDDVNNVPNVANNLPNIANNLPDNVNNLPDNVNNLPDNVNNLPDDNDANLRTQESDVVTVFDDESPAHHPVPISQASRDASSPTITPHYVTWNDITFPLIGDLIRLGRATQNEIILNQRGVSRFHAQIIRRGDTLYIEDLGSTNGTVMRGKRIYQAQRISDGDEVYLCDEKLYFHVTPIPDKPE